MKGVLRYGFVCGILLASIGPGFSQKNIGNLFVKNKYKGDVYFLDYYYEEAIRYYKLALKNDPNKDYLRLKIGDSYRLLGDHHSSYQYYEQVLEHNNEAGKPIHKYHYANALLAEGKLEEATRWYTLYASEAPDDSRVDRKLHGIDSHYSFLRDSMTLDVGTLNVNTEYSEFGATPYAQGLVFLSSKKKKGFIDQDYLREENLYDLYYTTYDSSGGGGWKDSVPFDKVVNTSYHEGPVTFYHGEEAKMIFTRSNYLDKRVVRSSDGKTKLQMYNATKVGDLWANIQPFGIRDPNYSLAHPALSQKDDTLFFVSDMPGGYGGSDLYMSVFSDGWSSPVNMGGEVNTEGNELYPYFTDDRLFFSSDGHGGLGGLDIYKASVTEGKVRWVANLGYPINSPYDDFSYTIDPESREGYFASNRPGGYGKDDIYTVHVSSLVLAGDVNETQTQNPLEGVALFLLDGDSVLARAASDADGQFYFHVPLDGEFRIKASKDEYSFLSSVIVSSRGRILDIDSMHISMRKHDLFAQGIVYDEETQRPMHDATVIIEDKTTGEYDTYLTDNSGKYNFVILPQREYAIKAQKRLFHPDSVNINTFSIDKGVILNDMILEEVNIDKETIFFDFNMAEIKPA